MLVDFYEVLNGRTLDATTMLRVCLIFSIS